MRNFQDREERQIRKQLLEKGRDLFSRQGIRKTSIDEIVGSVRIGKGSFYKFFGSKEELYFQIMSAEIKELAGKRLHAIGTDTPSRETLEAFLLEAVRDVSSNPILNKMLNKEEYACVQRKLTMAGPVDAMDFLSPLVAFFTRDGKAGDMQPDPMLMASVVKGLFLLSTHKTEIGEEYYEDVMRFYASMIAEKLVALAASSKGCGDQEESM